MTTGCEDQKPGVSIKQGHGFPVVCVCHYRHPILLLYKVFQVSPIKSCDIIVITDTANALKCSYYIQQLL